MNQSTVVLDTTSVAQWPGASESEAHTVTLHCSLHGHAATQASAELNINSINAIKMTSKQEVPNDKH